MQFRWHDLSQYLQQTLSASNSVFVTQVGESVEFEPMNLVEAWHVLSFVNITWAFGDGTAQTSSERSVTKSYGTQGTYSLTATITYEANVLQVLTAEVHVL